MESWVRCTWFFILSIPDLCHLETGLSPPVKYFCRPFQSGTSFVDHLCYLWLVFVMLLRLFIAGLLSPAGKGLTSWLSFVMLNCVFFTFPCGILCQVWYLIASVLETGLSPPVKYFTDSSQAVLLLLFMSSVCHAFASVHWCLMVTCWERADLLALVCDV